MTNSKFDTQHMLGAFLNATLQSKLIAQSIDLEDGVC